jgi:hypothetical protein
MDRKRNLAMIAATVAVALGAGQYLQSGTAESAAAMMPVPRAETPPPPRLAAGTPLAGHEPRLIPAAVDPQPPAAPPAPAVAAPACPLTLDVFPRENATLALSLTAPCRPGEGFVLRHGHLAVTYATTANGSFFLDLPALDAAGQVSLRFADGTEITAAAPVPDMAGLHRLAVQWIDGDRFTVSGDGPVVALGSDATILPMYAQIITLPAADAALSIESPVTAETCGREMMAMAVYSDAGRLTLADLSVALPDCDAEGGFVVLNNPLPDMKLAVQE